MRDIELIKSNPFFTLGEEDQPYGLYGFMELEDSGTASVIVGINEDFEHVSVSPLKAYKTPTWSDMCKVKRTFWSDDEQVIQIHPDNKHYIHGVGGLQNVLHLWAPKDGDWNKLMNADVR